LLAGLDLSLMGVHRGEVAFTICIRLVRTDLCITLHCIIFALYCMSHDKGWEREGKSRKYYVGMFKLVESVRHSVNMNRIASSTPPHSNNSE
jgi:hypothetical protein